MPESGRSFMKSPTADVGTLPPSLGTMLNGRNAAQSADGIPLDTFGTAGAEAVVTLFAVWGLAQLVWTVFGVLALTRYRAMIPLMFVLLLVEHLARRLIFFVEPIARVGTPPGLFINLGLVALMIVGLVLSLRAGRLDLPSDSTFAGSASG